MYIIKFILEVRRRCNEATIISSRYHCVLVVPSLVCRLLLRTVTYDVISTFLTYGDFVLMDTSVLDNLRQFTTNAIECKIRSAMTYPELKILVSRFTHNVRNCDYILYAGLLDLTVQSICLECLPSNCVVEIRIIVGAYFEKFFAERSTSCNHEYSLKKTNIRPFWKGFEFSG